MGNIDVPTQNNQPLKMPMGTYEFGANLVSNKVCCCIMGRQNEAKATCIKIHAVVHSLMMSMMQSTVLLTVNLFLSAGQHDDRACHDRWKDERQGQVSALPLLICLRSHLIYPKLQPVTPRHDVRVTSVQV